jgi:hypothetical protein
MKAVVVYESMYGNTRAIAEAIAAALGRGIEAVALPVAEAPPDEARTADLLVLGAPTHVLGLPRPSTRKAAAEAAAKPDSGLHLEPEAAGDGLREWLPRLGEFRGRVAVFDTRMRMPGFMGHASRKLRRLLAPRAGKPLGRPQSYLVSKQNELLPGELDRAGAWGSELLARLTERAPTG